MITDFEHVLETKRPATLEPGYHVIAILGPCDPDPEIATSPDRLETLGRRSQGQHDTTPGTALDADTRRTTRATSAIWPTRRHVDATELIYQIYGIKNIISG